MKKREIILLIMSAMLMSGCGEVSEKGAAAAYIKSSEIPPATVSAQVSETAAEPVSTSSQTAASETLAGTTKKSITSSASVTAKKKTVQTSASTQTLVTEKETTPPHSAATSQTTATSKALTPARIHTTSKASTTAASKVKPITQITSAAKTTFSSESTTSSAATTGQQIAYDTYYGVLIDEDCSDFEYPPMHDTPCMFMKECRASGYGIDIEQSDGTWVFYMFDDNGQSLAWDYLNTTERQDGLFVTVTGSWEDGVIKVISITES